VDGVDVVAPGVVGEIELVGAVLGADEGPLVVAPFVKATGQSDADESMKEGVRSSIVEEAKATG